MPGPVRIFKPTRAVSVAEPLFGWEATTGSLFTGGRVGGVWVGAKVGGATATSAGIVWAEGSVVGVRLGKGVRVRVGKRLGRVSVEADREPVPIKAQAMVVRVRINTSAESHCCDEG